MTRPEPPSHPSPTQLRAAAYANQRAWVRRVGAIDGTGHRRAVFERGGLVAVRTGTTGAIMLPDPLDAALAPLPNALAWLRHEGSGDVLIWADAPHRDADRRLSALGARESFSPRWMTRTLDDPLPEAPGGEVLVRRACPDDLHLLLGATELPYHSPWQARATLRLSTVTAPDDIALLVATVDGELAGRAVLSRWEATAGVYDVGVAPRWQRRGIGRQMMRALLETARAWRSELVTLNATPAGAALYQDLGFDDAGEGQTWLLPAATVRHPPAGEVVRFALAISGGEVLPGTAALARRHLPNGDTPLAHAARFEQPESAQRLLDLGTIPDIAALWRLDMEDAAIEQMRRHPEALDARRGTQQATPLHIAIYWRDPELLELLLDAGADPHVRDGVFDSDAWGWCHALGNDEALTILSARFPDNDRESDTNS